MPEKPVIGKMWVTDRGNRSCTKGDCPIESAVKACPTEGWLETVARALTGIDGLRKEGRIYEAQDRAGVFVQCYRCRRCHEGSICFYQGETDEAVKAAMDNG